MRSSIEMRVILFALLGIAVLAAPDLVLAAVFVVVLWALWRRGSRRRGVRQ